MKTFLAVLALNLFLTACVFKGKDALVFKKENKRDLLESSLKSNYSPSYQDIKKYVFEPHKCLNCHISDGLDLRTHESYLSSSMDKWDGVNLNSSSMFNELKSGSMPKNAPAISKLELALIEKYIRAGSPKLRTKIIATTPPVDGEDRTEDEKPVDLSKIEANYENLDKFIIKKFNCTKCHNYKKAKGGVNLADLAGILSSKYVPIDVDDYLDSTLYTSLMLYDDGTADMPPRDWGEPSPVSQVEIDFVKRFVQNCKANINADVVCP